MISFDEALAIVCGEARPIERARVPVGEAHRHVLAEEVVAGRDAPPADVSAMDGYAVRGEDVEAGRTGFRVIGESFAGTSFRGLVNSGECVRIFTGAPVPDGADRVIVQEMVTRDGETMTITGDISPASHIRKRGSDFSVGALLLEEGRFIDPRVLVAAAGADRAELLVWRRPSIAILSNGDELVEPGEAAQRPGKIPESLTPGIAAMADHWGGCVAARFRVGDDPEAMREAAASALDQADLLVMTGGASVGEKDFAKAALGELGLELLFSKVAIKPGKPVWFGRVGKRLVLGLPGNPTSAMVTARLLLAPLVAGLSGRSPRSAIRWRAAALKEDLRPGGDREEFLRARWSGGEVQTLGDQDSGAQKALSDAELLIRRRPNAAAAEKGAAVEVVEF